MQYLKAKKDISLVGKKYYFIPQNELLTIKEFKKLQTNTNFYNLSINDFELVKINKNKTAYFFGARIELKKEC